MIGHICKHERYTGPAMNITLYFLPEIQYENAPTPNCALHNA